MEGMRVVGDVFILGGFRGVGLMDVEEVWGEDMVKEKKGKVWMRKGGEKRKKMWNIGVVDIGLEMVRKYGDYGGWKKKGVLVGVGWNEKMKR